MQKRRRCRGWIAADYITPDQLEPDLNDDHDGIVHFDLNIYHVVFHDKSTMRNMKEMLQGN